MVTEIWQDFDPSLDIPIGLKNTKVVKDISSEAEIIATDPQIDIQTEQSGEDTSLEEGEEPVDALDAPSSFTIISQTVRTAPDGTQVVDVMVDVEDIVGAVSYQVRTTTV